MTLKIGIIRENKQPTDPRAPLSPAICKDLMKKHASIEIYAESSEERAYKDAEYEEVGVHIVESCTNCDVLLGVKEVPKEFLIDNKTYMFFSHTIKKQEYNREMFKSILTKKIELIDYETLTNDKGRRLLGFGKYAGIVGAYNGLLAWGKKHKQYELKPAYTCHDYEELKQELAKIELHSIKMVISGGGRVSHGAAEILDLVNAKKLSRESFLSYKGKDAVYCILEDESLFQRKDGKPWDKNHFYTNHSDYKMLFEPFLSETDLFINGIYWDKELPRFFNKEQCKDGNFKIGVIADITCDINGSIPLTIKDTKIGNPVFGWDRETEKETDPYQEHSIDIMAVSNLPAELPRDATKEFGQSLAELVLPEFLKEQSAILDRARLTTKEGKITTAYNYLSEYGS